MLMTLRMKSYKYPLSETNFIPRGVFMSKKKERKMTQKEETKTRPICTIQSCGPVPVTQHLYRCKTCHFQPWETMCESCAKFCHNTHQLEDLGYKLGYCWCGYGCNRCHCFCQNPVEGDLTLPDNVPRQCNFRNTGTRHTSMDMYHCNQCHLTGSLLACVSCYHLCHKGHGASYSGHSSSAYCDCGDPNQHYRCKLGPPSNPPKPIPVCTFNVSGKNYIQQKSYRCLTCGMHGNVTICQACADVCHAGHELEVTEYSSSFCDCGCGSTSTTCKLQEKIEPAQ